MLDLSATVHGTAAAVLVAGTMVILLWAPFRLMSRTSRRGLLMSMLGTVHGLGVAVLGVLVSFEVAEWLGIRDLEARKNFLLAVFLPYAIVSIVLVMRAARDRQTRARVTPRPPTDGG